jgi:hypothetical protein
MTRRPCTIRQADVTRALRAAAAAGLQVTGFNVDVHTGKIEVVTGKLEAQDSTTPLDQWMATHAPKT